MKFLRRLISWSPFLTGITVLLLLYLFDRWVFARFFQMPYWQWYLKNGALISMIFAVASRMWGDALDKNVGLISSNPLEYVGSWLQFIGLPVFSFGTQIQTNRAGSSSRSGIDGFLSIIWSLILAVAIILWFVVVAPFQFLVNFLCGAPARFAYGSGRRTVARFLPGNKMEVAEAHKQEQPLFERADIKNADSLIRKLVERRDSVSTYLGGRLSPDLRQQLNGYFELNTGSQIALQDLLVHELNEIMQGESIYLPFRFPPLTSKTAESVRPPDEVKLEKQIRLNRTLLEEAYPNEIVLSLPGEAADGWWDASFGRKPVSMTSALAALLMWVLQRILA